MNELSVEKATLSQLDSIAFIEKECFSDPWKKEDFEKALSNPAFVCFAAGSGDDVIGYGMMFSAGGEAEIVNIATDPRHRRHGVAEGVMCALLSEAHALGAMSMFLEVRESNTAAKKLYQKLGFEIIGRRKNYYRKPTEDALIMTRELTGFTGRDK